MVGGASGSQQGTRRGLGTKNSGEVTFMGVGSGTWEGLALVYYSVVLIEFLMRIELDRSKLGN